MLKCGEGSVTGFFVHLKAMHKITDFEVKAVKRRKILTPFLSAKSNEEEIDGFSSSSTASRKFTQENLAKNKHDKLQSNTRQSVSKMVRIF